MKRPRQNLNVRFKGLERQPLDRHIAKGRSAKVHVFFVGLGVGGEGEIDGLQENDAARSRPRARSGVARRKSDHACARTWTSGLEPHEAPRSRPAPAPAPGRRKSAPASARAWTPGLESLRRGRPGGVPAPGGVDPARPPVFCSASPSASQAPGATGDYRPPPPPGPRSFAWGQRTRATPGTE
jgi:hypothetical protein